MSLLGKLFGSSEVMKKGTEILDNAFYTDQEKAAGHIRLLQAYEAFKVAQRFLAIIVVPPWVLGWFICFICSFFEVDLTQPIAILEGKLGLAALTILGFYFCGGLVESAQRVRS